MNIQIIPAIDIIGGKCVRLHKGRFDELTTYDVPVREMLGLMVEAGFRRVHIVDLDGARAGEPVQMELIAGLAQQYDIQVQTGGGYRNIVQVQQALSLGINSVIIGSAAIRTPTLLRDSLAQFGSERIILAADVDGKQVRVAAWEEESGLELETLLDNFIGFGLKKVIITDIQRDGTLKGPATALYADLQRQYPQLQIIASGGIGHASHIEDLTTAGIRSVVLGKAMYERILSLRQLSEINKAYAG